MRLVTLLALSSAAVVACTSPEAGGDPAGPAVDIERERAAVDRVLSDLHRLASEGDFDAYFELLTDDAVFLGTDATERWSVEEFRSFAEPTTGWTYHMTERHIFVAADGRTAWFDERLDNERYGDTRGTGVLVKTDAGWKIAQYHLTIPMPNALAGEFVERIRAEAGGG
jgi:ketosteroid isomerase-like protein